MGFEEFYPKSDNHWKNDAWESAKEKILIVAAKKMNGRPDVWDEISCWQENVKKRKLDQEQPSDLHFQHKTFSHLKNLTRWAQSVGIIQVLMWQVVLNERRDDKKLCR